MSIGIGGIDLNDQFYVDSRRGDGLDLLGPASNVTMPYYLKNKNSVGYDQFDDNYDGTPTLANYALGTSWASAYTSGTATLLKQIDPTITPDQLLANLKNSGDPVVDPMHGVTYSRLNIESAIELTYKTQDDVYQGNSSSRQRRRLGFRRGHAGVSNAKLLIGKPDNYSFAVGRTTTIYFNTVYSGPSATPVGQVFDANGQLQGSFGAGADESDADAGNLLHLHGRPADRRSGRTGWRCRSRRRPPPNPATQAVAFSATPIAGRRVATR